MEATLLEKVFPGKLLEYFEITKLQKLYSVKERLDCFLTDLVGHNDLPNGNSFEEYEIKDFFWPKLIQDVPIRGKGVYLRIKKRRCIVNYE